MTIPQLDVDQVLKNLASQSMKQGSNVRVAVRDLTLKALQQRELTLDQIRRVLRSVTEGVSLGVGTREVKVEKALSDTVAGMDDALLKAVEASNVALHRLTGEGYDYEDSNLKQALDELERLEDEFFASIASASETAAEKMRAPWQQAISHARRSGTATGTQVTATLRDYAVRAQAAMRAQRATGFKTAHLLTQNFAILASGILIGMSEGLGATHPKPRKSTTAPRARKPAPAVKRKAPPATARATAGSAKGKAAKTTARAKARTAKRPAAKRARKQAGRSS
jgi:ElaB/YqjD/DUF883 family membrane-anchored ribosome-binding protein